MSLEKADVILLCGPPFVGRTLFYQEKLSMTHCRVCPEEIYRENPTLTIRQLVNKYVIKPITEGEKVVIDDSFQTFAKRQSFTSLVKKKTPDIQVTCCLLSPRYGINQLQWAAEYSFSQVAALYDETGQDLRGTINIEAWLQAEEIPEDDEDLVIKKFEINLHAETYYKFEVPALFIQWEGLIRNDGEQLVDGIQKALGLWYKTNPCGRILVLSDGKSSCGVPSSERDQQIQHLMNDLVRDLSDCPVYVMVVSPQINGPTYKGPPDPGIIACLQQQHCVDLQHPGTMYLYHTPSHMKMAEQAGLKHIKASRVFSNPSLAKSSHSMTQPKLPAMLRDLKVVSPSNTSPLLRMTSDHDLDGDPPPATVPLYSAFIKAKSAVGKQKMCPGRVTFVFCKDTDTMKSYHDEYSTHAMLTSCSQPSQIRSMSAHQSTKASSALTPSASVLDTSLTDKNRGLPKWMKPARSGSNAEHMNRSLLNMGDSSSLEQSVGTRKRAGSGEMRHSSVQYIMSIEELVEMAKTVLKEAGVPIPNDAEIAASLSRDGDEQLPETSKSEDSSHRKDHRRSKVTKSSKSEGLMEGRQDRESSRSKLTKDGEPSASKLTRDGELSRSKPQRKRGHTEPVDVWDDIFSNLGGDKEDHSEEKVMKSSEPKSKTLKNETPKTVDSKEIHLSTTEGSHDEDGSDIDKQSENITEKNHGERSNRPKRFSNMSIAGSSPKKRTGIKGVLFESSTSEISAEEGNGAFKAKMVSQTVSDDDKMKHSSKNAGTEVVPDSFVMETITTVPETALGSVSDKEQSHNLRCKRTISRKSTTWISSSDDDVKDEAGIEMKSPPRPKTRGRTPPPEQDTLSILDGLV